MVTIDCGLLFKGQSILSLIIAHIQRYKSQTYEDKVAISSIYYHLDIMYITRLGILYSDSSSNRLTVQSRLFDIYADFRRFIDKFPEYNTIKIERPYLLDENSWDDLRKVGIMVVTDEKDKD